MKSESRTTRDVHEFCAMSVGVVIPSYLAVYVPYKHTNGFTEAIAMLGKLALREANYLWFVPTNGFTTPVVTIGELARGKGLLVMRCWV